MLYLIMKQDLPLKSTVGSRCNKYYSNVILGYSGRNDIKYKETNLGQSVS